MGERTRKGERAQEVKLMISILTISVYKYEVYMETDSVSTLGQDREVEIGTGVSKVAE